MKVLIVDDDSSVHLDCEMILNELGIDFVKSVYSLDEGIASVMDNPPDFMLLDIYLGSEDGLDLLKYADENEVPTIVITGNPKEKFSKLSRLNIVKSFITKPINSVKLKYEVNKILKFINDKNLNSYLYYKGSNKIERIRYQDILYLETEGNYTTIVTHQKKHVLKKSLKQIMEHLSPKIFCQVFRSIVVNINHIKSVDFTKNKIFIETGISFPLGLKYKNLLKAIIEKKFDIL